MLRTLVPEQARFLRRAVARRVARTSAALLAAAALACSCASTPQSTLTLATTTSVANSGLLDVLVTEFRHGHGVVIRAHLVGSGRALAMLADAHAEPAISHAPDAEADAIAGPASDSRT